MSEPGTDELELAPPPPIDKSRYLMMRVGAPHVVPVWLDGMEWRWPWPRGEVYPFQPYDQEVPSD